MSYLSTTLGFTGLMIVGALLWRFVSDTTVDTTAQTHNKQQCARDLYIHGSIIGMAVFMISYLLRRLDREKERADSMQQLYKDREQRLVKEFREQGALIMLD